MPASLRSDGVRDHPGIPFGFPPERAFNFAGIPISEDLSAPGYANRFHLVVPNADLKPFAGWEQVSVLADGLGNMWLLIPQWGWAALTPTDIAVSQWLDGFTAFETRMQYVTITPHEILIEEPQTVIDVQRKRRGAGE